MGDWPIKTLRKQIHKKMGLTCELNKLGLMFGKHLLEDHEKLFGVVLDRYVGEYDIQDGSCIRVKLPDGWIFRPETNDYMYFNPVTEESPPDIPQPVPGRRL